MKKSALYSIIPALVCVSFSSNTNAMELFSPARSEINDQEIAILNAHSDEEFAALINQKISPKSSPQIEEYPVAKEQALKRPLNFAVDRIAHTPTYTPIIDKQTILASLDANGFDYTKIIYVKPYIRAGQRIISTHSELIALHPKEPSNRAILLNMAYDWLAERTATSADGEFVYPFVAENPNAPIDELLKLIIYLKGSPENARTYLQENYVIVDKE